LLNAEKISEGLSTKKEPIPANLIQDSIAHWRTSHYSRNPTEDTYYEIEIYRMKVSSQKRGETSRRFERLNQFFEEAFGTVCPYPQNIEKIH